MRHAFYPVIFLPAVLSLFLLFNVQWRGIHSCAVGMSLSAAAPLTSLGMCQMKMAPSVPAVTM